MEQFNLQKYLENPQKKIVTRNGLPARIICTNRESADRPIVSLVYRNGVEEPLAHDVNGRYSFDDTVENPFDLFFAPSNKSVWVFLYKSGVSQIISFACKDKSYAEQKMKELDGFGLTEISWEE